MSLQGVPVCQFPTCPTSLQITCRLYGGEILTFWGDVREAELPAVTATALRGFSVSGLI
jgi:hypothetical protein